MTSCTDLPPTITVPEAAELLGLSTTALYAAIRAGECPVKVLRIGRRIVVPTRPLLELLGLAESDPTDPVPYLSVIDGGGEG